VCTPPAFSGKFAAAAGAPGLHIDPASVAPEDDAQPGWAEEEEAGERAEALYDYTSEEAGDLHL